VFSLWRGVNFLTAAHDGKTKEFDEIFLELTPLG
jgi:hypothetical protein